MRVRIDFGIMNTKMNEMWNVKFLRHFNKQVGELMLLSERITTTE